MNIIIQAVNGKKIKLETKGFSGGERHIQLSNLPEELPDQLNIRCYIRSSDDLMDILLLQNALNNHYGKTIFMNVELPYLPYARQDRVCAQGQAFSLEVFSCLLQTLNIKQLTVWDCHSQVSIDLTGAINIEATKIIDNSLQLKGILQDQDSVLICPDKGAVTRCQQVVDYFNLNPMINSEKVRNPSTGKITHTEVYTDDLTGKTAIITDDICDGGYTFIKIAEQLKQKNVKKIILYVTHGIFSKGLSVFDGLIDEIYTTDSFPQQTHSKLNFIKVGEIV
ncbi:MAG: ribose-phosphate diphosphokinase [Proteobacteria bacterium]|nr:ribose-phosphate diphosphokinase [Pseudomonadota bacterium]